MRQENRRKIRLLSEVVILVLIVLIIGFFVALWLYGHGKIGPGPEERAQALEVSRVMQLQKTADDFVGQIEYIKDPTTGICFALLQAPRTDEPDTFAAVPCASVPEKILIVANPHN